MIKRYASRRLYNTETSDYVTLEDIARFIHDGRDVQILDLKSGDDLTRQYLLQIIAEHESRGDSVLPIDILTDLVRSYTTQATSIVPQFLEMSFQMLREGREKLIENTSISKTVPNFLQLSTKLSKKKSKKKILLGCSFGCKKSIEFYLTHKKIS